MTQKNQSTNQSVHPGSLLKRMLQGGGIAFILISIFLFNAGESKPEWGRFWMIRPLVFVPLAGAMAAVFYYYMDDMRYQGSWKRVTANVLSLIVFVFALWIGTVLGLDGTWWD